MKFKPILVKPVQPSFKNVVFLGKVEIAGISFKRVRRGLMTNSDQTNLLCYERDLRTKITYAIIRI